MMKSTGASWDQFKTQLNSIVNLDTKAMPFPWSKAAWENLENTWDQYYLNYQIEAERIDSFALWHVNDSDCAHLLKVVVTPESRGSGLGISILADCLETLSLRNFKTCYLEVGVSNTHAIKIYQQLGFKKLREIKSYYSDGSNAYAMQLILN